jgi:hypothetical protein
MSASWHMRSPGLGEPWTTCQTQSFREFTCAGLVVHLINVASTYLSPGLVGTAVLNLVMSSDMEELLSAIVIAELRV